MTTAGDTFRALADLLDQPEVMTHVALDVVKNQKKRIEQLEDLCRDLYKNHCANQRWHGAFPVEHLTERMDELGLLEGDDK